MNKIKQLIDWKQLFIAIIIGIVYGLSFCINNIYSLLLLLLFIPLWLAFKNRWYALLFIFFTYLSWGWEIIPAIYNYFRPESTLAHTLWLATYVYLIYGMIATIPWLICFPWKKKSLLSVTISFIVLMTLLTVPPFGVLLWGNPLFAAGLLFPGFSWLGLILCFVFIYGLILALYFRRCRSIAITSLIILILLSIIDYTFLYRPAKTIPHWTTFSAPFNEFAFSDILRNNIKRAIQSGNKVIILPESAVNFWSLTLKEPWIKLRETLAKNNVTLISGTYRSSKEIIFDPVSTFESKHEEGFVIVKDGKLYFHHLRQPLPMISWNPFSEKNVEAHWLNTHVFPIKKERAAIFICFEDFLPWLYITSMTQHPSVMITGINEWWNMPTSARKQIFVFKAWSRLINKPTFIAQII